MEQAMPHAIAFVDLDAQLARIRPHLEAAIARVLAHGQYIMGPEIAELERRLAVVAGARHALTCSSGTDALLLALVALGAGAGDAILTPTYTFAATAEVVPWVGAVPIFVDVRPDTFNLDPDRLDAGITTARRLGLRPVGVIAVDLFGQPADYDRIGAVAEAHGLWVIADGAQSFGATYHMRPVGSLAKITTTSFFPAKPLGCFGDGGALFTDDAVLAEIVRSLRVHGQGEHKYDNVRIGLNARLDTLQAAILLTKLDIFAEELAARQRAAERYDQLLQGAIRTPRLLDGATSSWAQYTLMSPARNEVAARLKAHGIPTAIYYARPLHRQPAYRAYPTAEGGCPVAERLAEQALNLPMHPYLDAEAQTRIATAVITA
jgi:dTDP-4-amino-4,6-dideoxygalactose transaminase